MPRVCGVDSSTSATKVEVRDADTGKRWGAGIEPHPPTTPPVSEQDPSSWWRALVQAFHQAGRYDVAAISVAGQQHGMVVLDSDDAPLRPAKLWNDLESAPDATRLVSELGAKWWASVAGSVPTASFTVTKLAWLKRKQPGTFAQMQSVLLPHDWLTFRLTGRKVTDRGDASGTGYWSPAEGRWRTDVLWHLDRDRDWTESLPLVLAPWEPAGPLESHAALALGLDGVDVVVGPGTGDNMSAALGIGLRPGDVVISLGTSGTAFAVADRPVADPTGAVAGFADATGRFLPLVCTLNATKVTDTVRRWLGLDHHGLDAAALSAPPGAGGVVLVPYFDGERTPNRPDATGILTGLRSDIQPAHLARAAFEGVVCGLLDGLDALRAAGVPLPDDGRLFLVGGGARSVAYRQIVADLTGRIVTVPDPSAEPVAVGAAVQAAAVLTKTDPAVVADAWGLGSGETVEPDALVDRAAVREAYAAARDASFR